MYVFYARVAQFFQKHRYFRGLTKSNSKRPADDKRFVNTVKKDATFAKWELAIDLFLYERQEVSGILLSNRRACHYIPIIGLG
jgi:hypothetical protein